MEIHHNASRGGLVPSRYTSTQPIVHPRSKSERNIERGLRIQVLLQQGTVVKTEYAMVAAGQLTGSAGMIFYEQLLQFRNMWSTLDDEELFDMFKQFSSMLLASLGGHLSAMVGSANQELQHLITQEIQPTEEEMRGFWRRLFGG